MATRRRPSAAARGYDQVHRNRVDGMRRNHVDGTPCWWCGLPMYRDRTRNPDYDPNALRRDGKPDTTSGVLAGDHPNPDAPHATRLLHGLCNKQRGDGSHDDERPALRNNTTEHTLGNLAMGWPAG